MNDDHQAISAALLEKFLRTKSEDSLKKLKLLNPEILPHWHHRMVLDQSRYEFYQKEINNAVKDQIVLDLGAGSGLLTQLALEAGAKHVYAIEVNPIIATCFEFSFEKEIKAGKVTFINKASQKLELDDLKHGTPDVVIHEIFGSNPLAENVLGTFSDLLGRKILSDEVIFVPQHFTINACLYYTDYSDELNQSRLEKFWYLEQLCYFDRNIKPGNKMQKVSKDFELINFDLKNIPADLGRLVNVDADSSANCLRLWFRVDGKCSSLTTDIEVEKNSHWGNVYHYLKCPAGSNNISFKYLNNRATLSRS